MSGRREQWPGRGNRQVINAPGVDIAQYQTIHFDPFEVDKLIQQHGSLCEYRKAIPCPCSRIETRTAAIGCQVCRGLRWVHPERCDWRFLDHSRTGRRQSTPAGRATHGELSVTFRMGIVPAEGDMVLPYCEEHVVYEHFVRDVQQVSERDVRDRISFREAPRPQRPRVERLLYPDVLRVEMVCWIRETRGPQGRVEELVLASPDTDYRLERTEDGKGRRIRFVEGRGPARGVGYAVRYLAPAAYVVMGSDPSFRHEADVALPYRATLMRLDAYQERDQRADTAIER